ncbi:RYamide receptor-like [Haliotis rufescens]|uniref:RYamide receptor-like n=1 Tax=Haliotis rufescens TaxID=6454 RepID=UPI00201E9CF9|nr:RYamide receptor-like [Haliotis rufescens]
MVLRAWRKVNATSIKNCFRKGGCVLTDGEAESDSESDDIPLSDLRDVWTELKKVTDIPPEVTLQEFIDADRVLVIKNPKLRNVTNLFICNLAISDILLAGIVLPQNLHDVSHPTDNYEGHAALKIIPVIWMGAAVVIIPTVIEYSVYISVSDDNNISATSCASVTFSSAASISNGFVLLLTAYIIPLIFILGNYLRILNFLREHGLCDGSRRRKSTPRGFFIYRHQVKIVKMFILVAALFAISWLPYFILLISQKISGRDDHMFVGGPINMIKISLASFSTAYNVVLYAIYNRNFRGAFRKMFYNDKTVDDGTDLGSNSSHSRSSTSLPLAARPPIVTQM